MKQKPQPNPALDFWLLAGSVALGAVAAWGGWLSLQDALAEREQRRRAR